MRVIRLKYAATCADCGAELPVGAEARYYGRGRCYGLNCHERAGAPVAVAPDLDPANLTDEQRAELQAREKQAATRDRKARGLCPTCGETRLSREYLRKGYQCDRCADLEEGPAATMGASW